MRYGDITISITLFALQKLVAANTNLKSEVEQSSNQHEHTDLTVSLSEGMDCCVTSAIYLPQRHLLRQIQNKKVRSTQLHRKRHTDPTVSLCD